MCVNTFTQLFNTSINRSETISDTGKLCLISSIKVKYCSVAQNGSVPANRPLNGMHTSIISVSFRYFVTHCAY
jgi:hypothetical protein